MAKQTRSNEGVSPDRTLGRRSFGLGLLLMPWAAGCGEEQPQEPAGAVVRLGIMSSDTDPGEARRMLGVGRLACREINDAGGLTIDGKALTLEAVLIGYTESAAGDAVPRMLAEGVKFVVGPVGSRQVLGVDGDGKNAAATPARDNGIIMISGSATNPRISTFGLGPYFWRTVPPDDLQAKVAVAHLRKERNATTMGIIHRDEPYASGLATAVEDAFTAAGGKVTAKVSYDASSVKIPNLLKYEYTSELAAVFAAKPEVIYLAAADEAFVIGNGAVLGGYHAQYGAKPPIYFGVDASVTFDSLNNGRPEFLANLSGTIPSPDKDGEDFKRFQAAMDAAALGDGINFESYRYDAFYIFAYAIQRANSLDSAVVKDFIREVTLAAPGATRVGVGEWAKGKAALLAGQSVNYDGASGPIEFEADGDPAAALYAIWKTRPKAGGGYEYDMSDIRPADGG